MPTILVIDDDVAILDMTRVVLEEDGYVVTTARNGMDGIDQALRQPFDVILCDEMMPVLAGHEVCERLYAKAETATTPIILMSAHYYELVPTTPNCLVFLRKPFTHDALMTTIEITIESQH